MPPLGCAVAECLREHASKGFCDFHYRRWRKTGDPLQKVRQPPESANRFWTHVDKTESCWLWTGSCFDSGYGQFHDRTVNPSRNRRAHRFSYEQVVGPIPDGLTLDHLCRVKRCVNPAHLGPVTQRENFDRVPKDYVCRKGLHPRGPGTRRCYPCSLESARLRHKRAREADDVRAQ